MRIALTHAFCWPEVRRGGERYLHELAGALARRDHDVTIIAGASRSGRSTEDGVRVTRIKRPTGPVAEAERSFARRVALPLLLKRYDVVHALGARDAATALRTRRGRRTVYTCLGLPRKASWDRLPAAAAHERVVRDIDVYGCLSRHARDVLQADYGRDGAMTPGGVSVARFTPSRRSERPALLFASALDEPRKGLGTLLEATAILARREPTVELWLCGPGDPAPVLEAASREARDLVRVLPLGSPASISEVYGSAWVTALPSTNEAFGLVLVESLACGTPVVGAEHAAIPEVVDPGVGTIAPPDDPVALADACERALALSREADIVDRCRAAAMRHDWDDAVAPAIEALYQSSSRDG